ncbi:unnamed protein product [Caenorhabditis sp. 36 PRJEB53466]|nr:unnamed protein product [Caenorhabditis sp. 36 PRJEB53466]
MLHFLQLLLLFASSIDYSQANESECGTEDFLKTFECIGGLAEFVSTVDNYNLTVEIDRKTFMGACKEASDCFSGASCLHADRLKLFLDTYCSYSTFLETEFKECKNRLDAREETQCEKSFKSFFNNTVAEDVKCGKLEESLKCVRVEVRKECGDSHADNIAKYLENMSTGLSCDKV